MKFLYILSIIIILIESNTTAQVSKLDDMKRNLSITKEDSSKIKIINKICVLYRNSNPTNHKKYIQQGLKLAYRINNIYYKAIFFREKGIYFKKKNELDSALYFYEQAQMLFIELSDSSLYQTTNSSIANVKKSQGKYLEAAEYFINAISFFEKQSDKKKQLQSFIIRLNLSSLYATMHENRKAVETLKGIIESKIAHKNKRLISASYINLVAIYPKLNQLDSALFYAYKAEKIVKNKRSLANLYINIGNITDKTSNYDESLLNYKKALKIYYILDDISGIIKSHNNLGNVYTKQNKLKQAKINLLKAKALLEKTENIFSLEYNYEMLISLYEKENNYKKAFKLQNQLIILKDSTLNIKKRKAISEIETKYEVEKNELIADNAVKEKKIAEVKTEKIYNYLIITGLLLLSLVLYIIFFRLKKQQQFTAIELEQTKKQLEYEKQYRNSELKALKAQMNPHFIFNALNSVQDLILLKDVRASNIYLGKFADLMRKTLNASGQNFIYLSEEIELLNLYLDLEKLRFGDDFKYKINCACDKLILEDIQFPPLLLQPYVENAIKHGLLHKKGQKKLNIEFYAKNELLFCEIIDNGVGRKKSYEIKQRREKHYPSFATKTSVKRIDLINKNSSINISLKITDLYQNDIATGTKIVFKISNLFNDTYA